MHEIMLGRKATLLIDFHMHVNMVRGFGNSIQVQFSRTDLLSMEFELEFVFKLSGEAK